MSLLRSHIGRRRAWGMLLGLLAMTWVLAASDQSAGARSATLLPVSGPIGPATSDFFVRKLHEAQESGAELVVVTIDTPGGLDTAMRDMIQAILSSEVPVVTYVSPSGARAASAGTYIVYASHVAAMAPATNLGAATPVQIGPGASEPAAPRPPADGEDKAEEPRKEPGTAMERKAVNDAIAYIRGLAELRGRNIDWAEEAVRDGASLPASEALEAGVVDLIASDIPDLLRQLDGRKVKIGANDVVLATQGMTLHEIEPDWRTELLSLLTNPNVAYLLMLIGIYGLLLEGYNPGAILPGVVGAICLLLALFAFQVLSVNYAGLALIALGVILIVAESFVPAFGSLGLGGIVAFVIGSVMLLDREVPGFAVAWQLIAAMALAGALVLVAIVSFAVRARRRPVVSGIEALSGATAEAVEDFEREGLVRVHGEIWKAHSGTPVHAGQRLRVRRVDGLLVYVEPGRDEP
jgi:membrane-bound serine protease (ClpP class)